MFLSLHRSEGFGRGIAESLPLGVDVIATAYAGNTDFCTDGHVWGEPDLDHAAELMQQRFSFAGAECRAGGGGGRCPPQALETPQKHGYSLMVPAYY